MFLKCIPNGMFGSNSYVIASNSEAAVIDAGVDYNKIYSIAKENNLCMKYIILTHGHVDHICEAMKLKEVTDAKILIHKQDQDMIKDPVKNLSAVVGEAFSIKDDIIMNDGDEYKLGELTLKIIHTPGHTPGCVCIKVLENIFSGDTLFKRSIGRTDLPNGNLQEIIDSIKNKLFTLDENIQVYPGHGSSTTIGYEKENNNFLK